MDINLEITRKKIKQFRKSDYKDPKLIKRHRWFFNAIKKFKKSGVVLDIGGREGFLADIFKQNGFKIEVIDISLQAVSFALERGHAASVCDAHHIDLKFKNQKFDIISLSHSLEHCLNPKDVIKKCRKILKKDGIIGVQIPFQKKIPTPTKYGHHHWFSNKQELFEMFEKFDMIYQEKGTHGNFIAIFKKH